MNLIIKKECRASIKKLGRLPEPANVLAIASVMVYVHASLDNAVAPPANPTANIGDSNAIERVYNSLDGETMSQKTSLCKKTF